jgi:teichuronic acid biosynthesis glycosyltransferase TuaG
MKPTVSVIIPTWNRAQQLAEAVQSVLAQTHPVLEILVCDDGSDDNSHEVITAFNDDRIRWIDGPRAGRPAVPRNRGIAVAKGEWLAFLDSDDKWLPEKIEQQLHLATEQNTKAVAANAWRVQPGKGRTAAYLQYPKNRIALAELVNTNFVICSSALVHSSCFETAKGFPEAAELRAIEDYALWIRIAAQTDFAYVKTPLVDYNDEPAQSVRANDVSVAEQRNRVFADAWNWCKSANSNSESRKLIKSTYKKALRANGKLWESFSVR